MKHYRIRWYHIYLTIWWFMAYGCMGLLLLKFFYWYLGGTRLNNGLNVVLLIHILLSLSLYVTSEVFEFFIERSRSR